MLELTLEINTNDSQITKKAPHESSTFYLNFIIGSLFFMPPYQLSFFSDEQLIDTSPLSNIKEKRDSIPIAACGFFKSTPFITSSDEAQELAIEM